MDEYYFPGPTQHASGITMLASAVTISNSTLVPTLDSQSTYRGSGQLSGEFPSALTTVEGVPVSAQVLVRYRAAVPGGRGDGLLVASTTSSSTGEWSVQNINSSLRFDVSARYPGENDALQSNVVPFDEPRFIPPVVNIPVGVPLNKALPVIGGMGSVGVVHVSGAYPLGVSLVSGRLQGSWPTGVVGTYPITYELTDDVDTYTRTVDLNLYLLDLVISPPSLESDWVEGVPITPIVVSATGGEGPYTYAVTAGSLPGGLSLNGSTGELSGTPSVSGAYSFSITATDVRSATAVRAYSGHISSDPYFSNVVLLAPFDGVAENVITNANFTVTGSAGITSGGKFADCATTANSGRFQITDANLAFGSEQCTIEFWVKPSNGGAGANYGRLLQIGDNDADGGIFIVRSNNPNPLTLIADLGTGSGYSRIADGSTTIPNDVWTHIALTRDASSVWRLFIGGVLQTTSNTNARLLGQTTLRLGQNNSGGEQFNGAYDDLRITKGVCRYTSTFTPPLMPSY